MINAEVSQSTGLVDKHLLIAGIYYRPEATGIATYTTALAEYLVKRGMKVTVLAGMPHYPRWRVFDGYEGRLTSWETLNGVDVRRLRTFIPQRQSAVRRAVYEFSFTFHILWLRKSLNPDAIMGVVPSLSGGLVAAAASNRFRRPYGLWVQDLTGPAAEQSGIAGGSGTVAKLTGRLEGRILRAARRIAIVSEGFRPYLRRHGIAPERLEYLPNWSHIPAPNKDRSVVRAELGWAPEEQVVLHAGNMGLKQGLENVVEAAKLLLDKPATRFVFLGDGSQRTKLETLARDLTNLRFMDPVADQDFANILSAADVLLVNERESVADMSLPSKLTSYFLVGRPVVAAVASSGATARFLNESGAALVVPAGDPRALVDALNRLGSEPTLRGELTASAARFASINLETSSILRRFEDLVTELVNSGDEDLQ